MASGDKSVLDECLGQHAPDLVEHRCVLGHGGVVPLGVELIESAPLPLQLERGVDETDFEGGGGIRGEHLASPELVEAGIEAEAAELHPGTEELAPAAEASFSARGGDRQEGLDGVPSDADSAQGRQPLTGPGVRVHPSRDCHAVRPDRARGDNDSRLAVLPRSGQMSPLEQLAQPVPGGCGRGPVEGCPAMDHRCGPRQ